MRYQAVEHGFHHGTLLMEDAMSDIVEAKSTMAPVYTIDAKVKWNRTGVFSSPGASIWVTVVGGSWTANPNWGFRVDGEGNKRYIGKPGYALPGVPEGALVGRLGNQVFYVGNRGRIPNTPQSEELFL